MFCRNCGKEIANTAMFCKYCGTKVNQINSVYTNQQVTQMPVQCNTYGVKPSINDVIKTIITVVSILIAIFALINIIAFFLPMEKGDNDSMLNIMKAKLGFKYYGQGLFAGVLSILIIILCTGDRMDVCWGLFILSAIVTVLTLCLVNKYNDVYKAWVSEDWPYYYNWKRYRGSGLVMYTISGIWIPICTVIKTVLVAIKNKMPNRQNAQYGNQ